MNILKRRYIEGGADVGLGCSGHFKLVVRGPDGTVRREREFDNLILDAGLNRWGSGGVIGFCAIGTGTAVPTASQTTLQAQSASTSTVQSASRGAQAAAPYYAYYTVTYRFALGALNGNYTEVGVGWTSTAMFSRALIVDGVGNPTSITVLSDEQLDVVYQLRIYQPTTDVTGVYSIGGVNYNLTARSAYVTSAFAGGASWYVDPGYAISFRSFSSYANAFTGAAGAITAGPSGTTYSNNATYTTGAYSNNSMAITGRTVYGLNEGNLAGGMRSMLAGMGSLGACFQYDFGAQIPKDATKTLTLNFQFSWGRRP